MTKRLGKNQKPMLHFAIKIFPSWHAVATDRSTQSAVRGLLEKGLVIVTFRPSGKVDQFRASMQDIREAGYNV